MSITTRGKKLKEQLFSYTPEICPERAKIITEAYMENEHEPAIIKRAKALYRILDEMSIFILDNELIVGNMCSKPKGAPVFPEFSTDWIERELDTFETREADKFIVSQETKKILREVLPYWRGKTTKDKSIAIMPEEVYNAHKSLVFILTSLASVTGHIMIDNEQLLKVGLLGIKQSAQEYKAKIDLVLPQNMEKMLFYKAVEIVCDAVINFANRYADLAKRMAGKENNSQRREELLSIAEVCGNVPARPAKSFHEAVQSCWFVHLVLQIESQGHGISPGRFDQYIYPYYKSDLESKRIDEHFATEILESYWVKLNEVNKVRDGVASLAFGGYPMFQNIVVGGIDAKGKDVTNELSYACIEVTKELKLPQPSLSVRIHKNTPGEMFDKSVELIKTGLGMPAFFNDEAIITTILPLGMTLEEARNYGIVSCVELQVPGKTEGYDAGGFLNIAKTIELTLNNGRDPKTGQKLGLETGEAETFNSYQEFFQAYKQQIEYFCRLQVIGNNVIDVVHGELTPMPFRALFVQDCLAKGKVIEQGGAKYNYTLCNPVGVANAADSMAVIKKFVFEEKKLTLKEMRDMLNKDFEGYEEIRQMFINGAPKYGNDDDYVDEIAKDITNAFFNAYVKYRNPRGGVFHPGLQSSSAHALFVDAVGSTPDGRTRKDLLADGGVSAAQGRDINGPTALIKSVAKLDHYKATGGTLLNIKFHPSALEGSSGRENVIALIKTYFEMGGHHIQCNCISSDMLKAAQKEPDKYPTLVVRVAGFSVLFNSIDKTLQDDIINRTEQMFM